MSILHRFKSKNCSNDLHIPIYGGNNRILTSRHRDTKGLCNNFHELLAATDNAEYIAALAY